MSFLLILFQQHSSNTRTGSRFCSQSVSIGLLARWLRIGFVQDARIAAFMPRLIVIVSIITLITNGHHNEKIRY